jgi:hypothetical protein
MASDQTTDHQFRAYYRSIADEKNITERMIYLTGLIVLISVIVSVTTYLEFVG